jgi:hypothetical protein
MCKLYLNQHSYDETIHNVIKNVFTHDLIQTQHKIFKKIQLKHQFMTKLSL